MDNKQKVNIPIIVHSQGLMLLIEGLFMLLVIPVTYVRHSGLNTFAMPLSAMLTIFSGFVLFFLTRRKVKDKRIGERESIIMVSFSWLTLSIFGCMPYLLSDTLISFTDAFYEALSGFTTTGASVITNLDNVNDDILFWRSLTQWMGGLVVLISLSAILPSIGFGGMHLFANELNGINYTKLHPRISHTVIRLWLVYMAFTLLELFMLHWGGMNYFDAACHSLTTVSLGGFSTHNDNLASFSPYSQIVIMAFELIAGCNFALILLALSRSPKILLKNHEFKTFIAYILITGTAITLGLCFIKGESFGNSLREGFISVISTMTTTGFFVSDYNTWPTALMVIVFLLMFIGACTGSTSGGIKILRHLIFLEDAAIELKRLIHPNAVLPVKVNGKSLSRSVTQKNNTFIFTYFAFFIAGVVIFRVLGLDFNTSMGCSIASLSNLGTGIGLVGPFGSYAYLPSAAKWTSAMLMLLGRVELFTLMIPFSRSFWKN